MHSIELAKKLSLHPRAVVLTGTVKERTKTSDVGPIAGYTPHYTARGCPPVQFAADGTPLPGADAAAIEAVFLEQAPPELAVLTASYGKPLNMVHLVFGRAGAGPNPAEVAVLREAGEIFRRNEGRPTLLVAVPTLATGAYGVSQGRLCPIGLFSEAGDALWLHPVAVGTLLQASYPATQGQRALQPAPAAPVEVKPHWYEQLSTTLKRKVPAAKLHATVIEKYADNLVLFGGAKNKTEAAAIAKREAADYLESQAPAPAPLPASPAKAAGARLSSAKV